MDICQLPSSYLWFFIILNFYTTFRMHRERGWKRACGTAIFRSTMPIEHPQSIEPYYWRKDSQSSHIISSRGACYESCFSDGIFILAFPPWLALASIHTSASQPIITFAISVNVIYCTFLADSMAIFRYTQATLISDDNQSVVKRINARNFLQKKWSRNCQEEPYVGSWI